MKNYNENNNNHIIETLIEDRISRNTVLINFMKMIIANKQTEIIAINGGWGTGKTFFIKHLELLINFINNCDENGHYKNEYLKTNKLKCLEELTREQKEKLNIFIDKKNIREIFNFEQTNCLYFNAWEYDDNENPILSIIYKMINDFPYLSANFSKDKVEKFKVALDAVSTWLTKGNLKISEITGCDNLVKDIITSEELKGKISSIFDMLMCENCNRLILVIDELDRCKPTFALKLLENLKHYINDERVTIILATNIYQLSNTIKNVYGSRFDVDEYLDKIIDITFSLKQIDKHEYIKTLGIGSLNGSSNWFSDTIVSYINYRNVEMRSINRFVKMMSMYENYIYLSYSRKNKVRQLLDYIFLPYYLGEQIFNTNNHNDFIRGNGFDEFYNYISNSDELSYIIGDCLYDGAKDKQINYKEDLKKIYDMIYNNSKNRYFIKVGTEDFDITDSRYFYDLCTMLNDYNFVTIEEEQKNT